MKDSYGDDGQNITKPLFLDAPTSSIDRQAGMTLTLQRLVSGVFLGLASESVPPVTLYHGPVWLSSHEASSGTTRTVPSRGLPRKNPPLILLFSDSAIN